MGWFSNKGDESADSPDEKPWNKPLSDEAADKLLKALEKRDPRDKNDPGSKPEKRGWF